MRRSNPSFSGRGRGGPGTNSTFDLIGQEEVNRSHTPSQQPTSWRTIAKKHNSSHTKAFYKGVRDIVDQGNTPEPFTNIVKEETKWFEKSHTDIVLYLEPEDIALMQEPETIRQRYLHDTYYPTLSLKPRAWIRTLLSQKGMEITHFWTTENHSVPPGFSKCVIREVILPRNWALNPNEELPLVKVQNSTTVYKFNYWDYKQAFFDLFLYQNPKQKHTWLIKLCPEALQKGVPNWFYKWWETYGIEIAIIPEPILKLYSSWVDSHPKLSRMDESQLIDGMCFAHFFAEVEIPWIWNWSLKCDWTPSHIPILKRTYHCRWWNGICLETKVKELEEIIQRNKSLIESNMTQEVKKDNPMTKIANLMRRKYPQSSEAEIKQKCLEYFKRQFFEAFDEPETTSHVSSMEEDTPGLDHIQDAQDPEDIWAEIFDNPPDLKGKSPAL